ncbi:MAG: hypothetical protein LAT55_12615 [Opitutales bacterium]|nr:hypothetical protein [Opitutales bacterium]
MSKDKIESAVARAAKAMTAVVTAVEKTWHAITPDDLEKALRFMRLTMDGVEQRARMARNTAIATSGTFSFDMELPEPETTTVKWVSNHPAMPATQRPGDPSPDPAGRARPEGRLVGKKGPYYPEALSPPRAKTASELEVEPGEVPDPNTGFVDAGFIDD